MSATSIENYLVALGVEPPAARLFIDLGRLGFASALQLARITGISRTQVYRYLEALQRLGLVTPEQLHYGTLYRALALENIENYLADRAAEIARLRRNLADAASALQVLAGGSGPKATVQHLYGEAGLKQAHWNLSNAHTEFRVLEASRTIRYADKTFARHCQERIMERLLTRFTLTNAAEFSAPALTPFTPERSFFRHIDASTLAITFEAYIYNDIVTLIDGNASQQLILEVSHPSVAAMMRQLFDSFWTHARPLPMS